MTPAPDCTCTTFTSRTDVGYIAEVADRYLTLDGRAGRIIELLDGGGEIVICTHWQSLFSNGTHTGVRVLAEIARRVRAILGDRVEWMRCSEIASRAVAAGSDGTV